MNETRPSSGKAQWSAICSLNVVMFGPLLGLVGVALGFFALRDIRQSDKAHRRNPHAVSRLAGADEAWTGIIGGLILVPAWFAFVWYMVTAP